MRTTARRKKSIAHRLILFILLFSSFVSLIGTGIQLFFDYREEFKAMEERTQQIEKSYLQSLSNALWVMDRTQLRMLLHGISRFPDFKYVDVHSEEGLILESIGDPSETSALIKSIPLSYDQKNEKTHVGTLKIVLSTSEIKERLKGRVFVILATQTVKTFLVSSFIFFAFQLLVTRHLTTLARHLKRMEGNFFDDELNLKKWTKSPSERDELEEVAFAMNSMRLSLKKSYRDLKEELEKRALAEKELSEQREWLEVTLSSIHDSVLVTDTTGNIRYLNSAAKSLTGLQNQQNAPQMIDTVLKFEGGIHPVLKDLLSNCTHAYPSIERNLVCASGKEIPVELSASVITNAHGITLGVVLILRDISLRNKSEQARRFLSDVNTRLAAASLDFDATLIALADLAVPYLADCCMVHTLEKDGRLQIAAMVGRSANEEEKIRTLSKELTKNIFAQVHGPLHVISVCTSEFVSKIDDQFLSSFITQNVDLASLKSFGFQSYMAVPLLIRGQCLGCVTFLSSEHRAPYDESTLTYAEDLARRAALAIENAKLYRESQILNRTKDEFLATVSHELRTPLNAILGWSQLLRSGELNHDDTLQAIDHLDRNAQTQCQLVEELLDASKIITGKLVLNISHINFCNIVTKSLESIQFAAKAKGVLLFWNLSPEICLVAGDLDRLRQIVWNLLSNALKFTPTGGSITVSLRVEAQHLILLVTDNGQGIQSEFLPFVFERFRQEDSTYSRAFGGLGLGLAIVKHLVELHGGNISVSSEGKDKGAVFSVMLPILTENLGQTPHFRPDEYSKTNTKELQY
jgi:PAS domain S-box-containing protein